MGISCLAICCYCLLSVVSSDLAVESFGISGTLKNGFLLNFYLQIRDSYIAKPYYYNRDTISELENRYRVKSNESVNSVNPDIIVIMDESFADLRVLGSEIRSNVPITPFIDSLQENTIKGFALSSVYGGKTPNSEFEFLTGNSMAFLPSGSIPYQQYIHSETYSMVSFLKSKGYKTIATHPFHSNGWKREKVYSMFGFDDVSFVEAYPQKDLVKGLVSDREMFDYIIDILKNKQKEEKVFLYGVTMQNHGGYEASSDFTNSIKLQDYSSDYSDAEQYFSLINLTDSALKHLIDYPKTIDNNVILLFYGDHFPNLNPNFYQEVHGGPFTSPEEEALLYKVPFIIWANYDIEENNVDCTSINFLSNYLYEAAGIDLPPYNLFLKDLQKQYSAINDRIIYSAETGNSNSVKNELSSNHLTIIQEYQILQYNSLFDKNRSNVFFGYK